MTTTKYQRREAISFHRIILYLTRQPEPDHPFSSSASSITQFPIVFSVSIASHYPISCTALDQKNMLSLAVLFSSMLAGFAAAQTSQNLTIPGSIDVGTRSKSQLSTLWRSYCVP